MRMHEYWTKGIPCYQFRKERISDIDMMISIQETMNQKNRSISNQENLLNDLLKGQR